MIESHETGRSPWNREEFHGAKMDELVESIRQRGIIQPIVVRENPGYLLREERGAWRVVSQEGTVVSDPVTQATAERMQRDLNFPLWEIIAGERRWRAAQTIGLRSIPAIVRKAGDRETLEIQATENLQREDLNVIHEAQKYRQLMDVYRAGGANGEAVDLVAKHVGRSRSHVYEKVKLLTLAADAQEAVVSGRLPSSHAALITRIEDPDAQRELVSRMLKPQDHETDEDENDAPLAQRLTVMSFRNAKRLVEDTAERLAAAEAYDAAVALANAEGRKVLSEAEIKKVMPYGYPSDTREYIAADATAYDYRNAKGVAKTYRALLGSHAPPATLGRDRVGGPVDLYPAKALAAALKAAGVKKPAERASKAAPKKSADEVRAEQAQERRVARWRAYCDGLRTAPGAERLALVLALTDYASSAGVEPSLLDLPPGASEEEILAAIPKLPMPKIRAALIAEILNQQAPYHWHKGWNELLIAASAVTGLPLPPWDDDVQTSGKDGEE